MSLEVALFNKWPLTDVKCQDESLEAYISIDNHSFVPHSAGRWSAKRFRKAKCPVVERLTNSLMMHGRNSGKKLMAMKTVGRPLSSSTFTQARIPSRSWSTQSRIRARVRIPAALGRAARSVASLSTSLPCVASISASITLRLAPARRHSARSGRLLSASPKKS